MVDGVESGGMGATEARQVEAVGGERPIRHWRSWAAAPMP